MIYYSILTKYTITNRLAIRNWIDDAIREEGFKSKEITFILCDDEYLLDMNKKYLEHDYYTDVITFDYTANKEVSGDIFISVDRIKENAKNNNVSEKNELYRVMIHGVLHLCGYKDKTIKQKEEMTQKENYYLEKMEV
ncbi:MAG: rRNA maturation RNase YbeY [Flavobacteriales bacterium]|nr:rRNA maturation RNase YbeY [Flavobacteriales bacterium]